METLRLGLPPDRPPGPLGLGLVGRAAPVEGGDRALVLEANAKAAQLGGVGGAGEVLDTARPGLQLGIPADPPPARREPLAAVVSDVGDRADRDDPPRVGGP